jgi:hypothetical protein
LLAYLAASAFLQLQQILLAARATEEIHTARRSVMLKNAMQAYGGDVGCANTAISILSSSIGSKKETAEFGTHSFAGSGFMVICTLSNSTRHLSFVLSVHHAPL